MQKTLSASLLLAVISGVSACHRAGAQDMQAAQLQGLYSPSALWPNSTISVCWMTDGFEEEKEWVRSKIQNTWQRHSELVFTDWNDCTNAGADITIAIRDDADGIYTLGLGRFLRNKQPSMILNFTFENWSQSCASSLRSCIETNAAHEFGHAIGLSHEHNRTDRDWDCTQKMQGGSNDETRYGSFDHDSIMNYCYHSSYKNRLSDGDIRLVQYLYGPPSDAY